MKFDKTNHRKLWLWLADNPEMNKEDLPEWESIGAVYNNCFACDCLEDKLGSCIGFCPLVWPDDNWCLMGDDLFTLWMNSTGQTRADLARTIAELPVREGVECI